MAKLTKLEKLTAKLKDIANDIATCDATANERWDALHDGITFLAERSRQCWLTVSPSEQASPALPPGGIARVDDPDADLI